MPEACASTRCPDARSPGQQLYRGQQVAFLTQHGKERVVAPILADMLGCRVERIGGFDTDQLGSFTREIPRYGKQLEAARRKARIGMELSGASIGLASEGSFGPDPHTGLFPWNIEVMLLVDDLRKIEVVGIHQGPASTDHAWIVTWAEMEEFATRIGFPEQHLVLRPSSENNPRVRKGLADWPSLKTAFAWAKLLSSAGTRIFVERDLRAHGHPERMVNIGKAALNLAEKLASLCPHCATPGFAAAEAVPGLHCAECGLPTREYRAEIWKCLRCEYRETRQRSDGVTTADPVSCGYCNP
ncbi:DUF6671 family protein [uncultured Dechloromonas sp.]|uniref:DUF6671 family protein n=1 Tax=uncultured Dechloromonas sp. TaxID=171719 RepID=UPI0025FA29A8|nr:DUF6671 family protein [uncultured Dechloromonas sp.]